MIKLRIASVDWNPADGLILEDRALEIVRSPTNFYVIAGPGAGKTELLAQRACFLLQTNICREPRRILAISFKKDAAQNIAERVKKRCGDELARRFISRTYDSFAKSLLDHFRKALPHDYMPSKNYTIEKSNRSIVDQYFGSIQSLIDLKLNNRELNTLSKNLTMSRLPLTLGLKGDINELIYNIWMDCLKGNSTESKLTFEMILRLSELLIRLNPKICDSLVATYSHIFLDEFQDTTNYQYDLIKTCFHKSDSILTAVGDSKQRIMTWAGADIEVFEKFRIDFNAKKQVLLMNYRSAPRLVEVQKILMKNLGDDEVNISTSEKWNSKDGICEVWNFQNYLEEANTVSKKINRWIISEKLNPNDICIIVKQKPEYYSPNLIKCMSTFGIKARNENLFQELISDEFVILILDLVKCAMSTRSREEWLKSRETIKLIHGISMKNDLDFKKLRLFDKNFRIVLQKIKNRFLSIKNEDELGSALDEIIEYINKDKLASCFPQYSQWSYFENKYNQLREYLWNEFSLCRNWIYTTEYLKGLYSIPIMTIHKSKGLEYNTVIFIGLEDSAFWNFRKQPEEDICAFFVALSRAKKRIIFTFSETRIDNGRNTKEKKVSINSLYQMLEQSGIVDIRKL